MKAQILSVEPPTYYKRLLLDCNFSKDICMERGRVFQPKTEQKKSKKKISTTKVHRELL